MEAAFHSLLFNTARFAAISDAGLVEGANISNWLLERNAFIVGHIVIPSHDSLAKDSGINEMIEMYDQITAFTWSDAMQRIVSPRGYFHIHSNNVVPSYQLLQLIAV